jgi:NAD(P)-dependent dehydrogenase (short-subunit alcohol dehydrogenase family)
MVSAISGIIRFGGFAKFNIAVVKANRTLVGKRILVTGGGSGIGLSVAKKCVNEGATVVITGRDLEKLERAVVEIGNQSLKVLEWDVAEVSQVDSKLSTVEGLLGGGLDVLVNNAGVLQGGAFPRVSEEVWDTTYAINSKGVFFLTQRVCEKWMGEGRDLTRKVLNISSQGGFVGATYPYRMTKWDIAGLTQGLGIKLAPHGIIVNGIAPGVVVTDMQKNCQSQQENCYYGDNPIQRFALPDEIAELAWFLISDASNFIVGQTIVCDGGFSIK